MQSRSKGAAAIAASTISLAAEGCAAIAARMMQSTCSQESSLPTGCLKSLKSVRGLTLLTVRAATTIRGARSGRARTAAPTYSQISCAVDRTKSELSAGKNGCARDRGGDGPHFDLRAAGFLRHIKQNLAAAQINGSRPFAHTKDRLLAKARDRLILKSQLTPGLGAGLHCRTLVNIIVYYSRTR